MDAFTDFKVQPVYGQFRALLTWSVSSPLEGGHFEILKSTDGLNDWQVIGTADGESFFVDENLLRQGRLFETFYQVKAQRNGHQAVSSVVGTFGTVSRMEFGAARRIMEMEYQALRCFTKVHLFKLRVFAPPCPLCVSEDTGQAVGTALCERCYGTQKDRGYADPVVTYMRIMTISPVQKVNSQDGTGATDPSEQLLRMPAFPLLRQGDLLVHKEADRRYIVNSLEPYLLGGKIPVVVMVNASLLTASDVRYKVPLL